MGEVLHRSSRVPRTYLLPAPLKDGYQPPTFHPAIAPRSKVSCLPRCRLELLLDSHCSIYALCTSALGPAGILLSGMLWARSELASLTLQL